MAEHPTRKLAVILHADVVGSTRLVQQNETLAHARIRDAFRRFSSTIEAYNGATHELRGDALVAEFARASDAVPAALAFQIENTESNARLEDDLQPRLRIGISLGEVVVADNTVTGAGVVLAQRVEQLAEPGGVCITGAVHEAVPQYLPLHYSDLGKQEVKGFGEPVQVYSASVKAGEQVPHPEPAVSGGAHLRKPKRLWTASAIALLILVGGALAWWQPWKPVFEPSSTERMAFPLPDKPSIAVLPFTNMSDDPQQEYFVDGMTEDLITDLAKIESLFVIARNTVFRYKGKSVVVPDVARELGIKYVLEGSVRRVGEMVRINAQLIDGASGAHMWAERYDGTIADIFALQDEVTSEIVAQLQITLTPDEQIRRNRKDTENSDAHDAYLRGWQLYRRYTPEDFVEAIPHLKRAVELDPEYGQAWATLASIYWISYRKGYAWSQILTPGFISVSWQGTRYKAVKFVEQALRNPTPLAHQVESQIWWDFRQFDKALGEAEKAVTLDPSDPEGQLAMAWALIFAGRAEAAIAPAESAIRLDPHFPANYRFALGTAQLMLKRYAAAATTLKSTFELNPGETQILVPLAVAYAQLGRKEEARAALQKYTDFLIYWEPRIDSYMQWWPFKREADFRLFGGGLIKAGLCCDDQLEVYIDRLRQGGTLE